MAWRTERWPRSIASTGDLREWLSFRSYVGNILKSSSLLLIPLLFCIKFSCINAWTNSWTIFGSAVLSTHNCFTSVPAWTSHQCFANTAIRRSFLQGEFRTTPAVFLDAVLLRTNGYLFPAYLILEEAERTWSTEVNKPYIMLKKARQQNALHRENRLEQTIEESKHIHSYHVALKELLAARQVRMRADGELLLQFLVVFEPLGSEVATNLS